MSGRPPMDPRDGEPRRVPKPGRPDPGQSGRPRKSGQPGAAGRARSGSAPGHDPQPGGQGGSTDRGRSGAGRQRPGKPARQASAVRQLPPRPGAPRPGSARPGGRGPGGPGGTGPRTATFRLGSPHRRLRITMFGLLFAFSLFAGRLFQLQAVDARGYAADSENSRLHQATLYAKRGDILAADGTPLATTVEAYDVEVDPKVVRDTHEDVDELASKLAGLFSVAPEFSGVSGLDTDTLRDKLTRSGTRNVILARKASPDTVAKVNALTASNTANARHAVGLSTTNRDDRRVYPAGTLGANLVGYTNTDGKGIGGLEQLYDSRLTGTDGRMSDQVAAGVEIPTAGVNLKPAVDGSSVLTTIDPDIQFAADQAIADEVRKSGAASGTVVVEDVATGRILALANAPTFDPSHITEADVPNLGNRAFTDPFEPGSVAKIITMSAAIQEGAAQPDTHIPPFSSPEYFNGIKQQDDTDHGPWDLTMTGALARSSNLGTIAISDMFQAHGLDRGATLYKYQRLFGLGSKTSIDFPGESAGIIHPPEKWQGADALTVAYGQGMSATAIQDAAAFQTIANGGVRIEPSLVTGTRDPSGKLTPAAPPAQTQVVSSQTASEVADMLESVITDKSGTANGTPAQIPGYRVAGKTGTAQRYDDATGGYNGYTASFIGFAPTDKPQIVVAVSLQAPKGAHFGSEIAAPVFQKVMEFALRSRGVPPTGTPNANLPTTY